MVHHGPSWSIENNEKKNINLHVLHGFFPEENHQKNMGEIESDNPNNPNNVACSTFSPTPPGCAKALRVPASQLYHKSLATNSWRKLRGKVIGKSAREMRTKKWRWKFHGSIGLDALFSSKPGPIPSCIACNHIYGIIWQMSMCTNPYTAWQVKHWKL